MLDLNNEIFDFSKESNLKEKLWEQMQHKLSEHAPLREEVSLESISPQMQEYSSEHEENTPQNKRERSL